MSRFNQKKKKKIGNLSCVGNSRFKQLCQIFLHAIDTAVITVCILHNELICACLHCDRFMNVIDNLKTLNINQNEVNRKGKWHQMPLDSFCAFL